MRDVVVVGGGLSGLAACYELEKRAVRYTLIEVKDRLGGSIRSRRESGFLTDAYGFACAPIADTSLLRELGLDAEIGAGAGELVEALSSRLAGGRLLRMAVSSIGRWKRRFTLCLENGMVLDAGAVILAAPARYSERMLHNLAPEISLQLRDYEYDTIFRVTLGYHKRDLPKRPRRPFSMLFPFIFSTDAAGRVPDADHLLLQVGVRSNAGLTPQQLINAVIKHYGWGAQPLLRRVDYWPEADPLSCYDDQHRGRMAAIRSRLPAGMALIGGDYCLEAPQRAGVAHLDERLRQGQAAARDAVEYLRGLRKR